MKGSSHTPRDYAAASRNRTGGNVKRRGRPPKKQATVPLSPAEHEALLSNAINNATQRLHLHGLGIPLTPAIKPAPPVPHPLSQSHVATSAVVKRKKKKKKDEPNRTQSRNSSQASSSSDSDEEEESGKGEEEGEEEEGEVVEDDRQNIPPARRKADGNQVGQPTVISENPSISTVSVAPAAPAQVTILPRPALKRRSSSQADSTDGSDSD